MKKVAGTFQVPSAAGTNTIKSRQRQQYKRTAHGVCLLQNQEAAR